MALSGLERYRGAAFPAEYRGNLFSAQHNARRVGRHALVPDGSTFRSEDSDFLTSDDPDFHPSDVLEDADGSLLVVDTGAWYVQHCPTGRIRASDSRGGIYRVRRADAPRLDDPRGLRIDWATLPAGRLGEPPGRPPPRRARAGRSCAGRSRRRRRSPRWATSCAGPPRPGRWRPSGHWRRSRTPPRSPPLRSALADADEEVACAAARALARRADRGAAADLARLIADGRPRVRLAAAEALARCGDRSSLPAVWRGVAAAPDRFLEHALVHAAHRLADADALEAALARPEPPVQGAALLLLDQPPRPRGRLGPGPVVARASSPDAGLRRTALRVLMRHPEWSGEALDHIRGELGAADPPEERLAALADLILAFQDRADVQDLLAGAAADITASPGRRAWSLATMARSRLSPLPGPWVEALAGSLGDPEPSLRRAAVRAAATLQVPRLDATLLALADGAGEPPDLRLEALRAALPRHPEPSAAAFELLIGQLGAKDDPLAALAAGELAGRVRLDESRLLRLLEAVRGSLLVTPATAPRNLRPAARRQGRRGVGRLPGIVPPRRLEATGGRSPRHPGCRPRPLARTARRPCPHQRGGPPGQAGPPGRVRALIIGGRPGSGAGRLPRLEGRLRDLPSARRRGGPGRPRSDQDRRHPFGPRPPGVDPLAQLDVRPGLRALHRRDGGRPCPRGTDRPAGRGRPHPARFQRSRDPAAPRRHRGTAPLGDVLDARWARACPDPRRAPRPARLPPIPELSQDGRKVQDPSASCR